MHTHRALRSKDCVGQEEEGVLARHEDGRLMLFKSDFGRFVVRLASLHFPPFFFLPLCFLAFFEFFSHDTSRSVYV